MAAEFRRHRFPPIWAINERLNDNLIQQLLSPSWSVESIAERYAQNGTQGRLLRPSIPDYTPILIVTKGAIPADGFDIVLAASPRADLDNPDSLRWVKHPKLLRIPVAPIDYQAQQQTVLRSWRDAFSYREEDPNLDVPGLRSPQVGAIHAAHAHWATTKQVATIVMPTGTGKTETMVALLVSKQCQRLLVVVPTDALRTQIAGKFLTLGILKDFGVISDQALYPIVGILKHKPKCIDEVDEFFGKCNVIVTTVQIAGQCTDRIQERMAQLCPYLFIDEAHHIGATTWHEFRNKFQQQSILQFTATPFRNDGKLIGGKIIFNYPLRKALSEGYFKKISFQPIWEYNVRKSDQVIAQRAVAQLRKDLEQYDHILMARVDSIERAHQVFAIYSKYSDLNPVEIHTGIPISERERVRQMILSKQAKIVVCVDMLGEGFDLPELKVAALHDVKKSLAITLQLTGRFTRANPRLGEPTFIANIGLAEVQEELKKLYTQDADWNVLLSQSSEKVIEEQVSWQEFLEGFHNFPNEIPLQNVRPAMSTVVYKTKCQEWKPENFKEGIEGYESLERLLHDVNYKENTLVIVTAQKVPIEWAQIQDLFNWDWELFVVHWDNEQNLLYINGSSNSGNYQELAEAVAGEVELVQGREVFRCFAGVNRLKLQNVGLIEQLGQLIRYTMCAGADVEAGLSETQKQNRVKANIFGNGYENGRKTTVGCSYRGRIWSQKVTNVEALTRWCKSIGKKVLDGTINPDEVLSGTLIPVQVSERPHKMPVGVDWPDVMYREPETAYEFGLGEETPIPLCDAELQLHEPSEDGEIAFKLCTSSFGTVFTLTLSEKDNIKRYHISTGSARKPYLIRRASRNTLEDFFNKCPPIIWFADGSSLEGNLLTELKRKYPPYPADRIEAWDWTGVDIKKESQGRTKEPDSIQYRVIDCLKRAPNAIVFDDDASGEAADVVAIAYDDRLVSVDLYHCKFSLDATPGARVKDLYELCGQAQKCVHWMENPTELFKHLLKRQKRREDEGGTRLEKGDMSNLLQIAEMSHLLAVSMKVHIVQPGLSKQEVSREQLELLSVTENYLMETYRLPFSVIASR